MNAKITPEFIEAILKRVPEGFIHRSTLDNGLRTSNKNLTKQASRVGRERDYYFDAPRITREQVRALAGWSRPAFPALDADETLADPPISEQLDARSRTLAEWGDDPALRVMAQFDTSPGYIKRGDNAFDASAIQRLLGADLLREDRGYIYDPLRLSRSTIDELLRRETVAPQYLELVELLRSKPGSTMPEAELAERFGIDQFRDLLGWGDFVEYSVPLNIKPYKQLWVRLASADADEALTVAQEAVRIRDEAWQESLEETGDFARPGAKEGSTRRSQVIARSYLLSAAAKRLGVHEDTLQEAIEAGVVPAFVDPEEKTRLPADEVEAAFHDPEYAEQIAAFETLKTREIALVLGVSFSTIRSRLQKQGLNRRRPQWGDVRGRWRLPDTLREFKALLREKLIERRSEPLAPAETRGRGQRALTQAQIEEERERRRELRKRLLASFPTWQHEGRAQQRIFLHVGPTNSGKTHDALVALADAGSGWYLAPLRLLAFEVFDRLNERGVRCNLLTGEEYIPIPGAAITAATVEMFNSNDSGRCVVIDEAHMLADPDRGWAWTRAFMEAQAPEIRVISPPFARDLIEQMSNAAGLPITVVEHQRLTPIRVAERFWTLNDLPSKTILVAFSRQSVLQLKTELERMKRSVSVVYGNLPPEVRRKQAERFATGQTDICVATDAVGMGLNLPADHVCFYEAAKFDGRQSRVLYPNEVQQIGGRAGRYGYSEYGEVGAMNKQDLRLIRQLFNTPPEPLTHAHVAPTVDDLEMIPGSLAERLLQWSMLQSIPEALRRSVRTADLTERIELAAMLTDREVAQLGLAAAMRLINAPTRTNTRSYWYECAQSILARQPMTLPPLPPAEIVNSYNLEAAEISVACADIYLWLSRRPEFERYAPDAPEVRLQRGEWSQEIDGALLRRLDSAKLCVSCGKPLPRGHRYRICDDCFRDRRRGYASGA